MITLCWSVPYSAFLMLGSYFVVPCTSPTLSAVRSHGLELENPVVAEFPWPEVSKPEEPLGLPKLRAFKLTITITMKPLFYQNIIVF